MNAVTSNDMVFCRACGKQLHISAPSCPGCGALQSVTAAGASDKTIVPALLLCFFVGYLGIHRFYAGKVGTGILYLFTFGLLGIGVLVDLIMIVMGSFTDSNGKKMTQWT